jgi:hypothetical protein
VTNGRSKARCALRGEIAMALDFLFQGCTIQPLELYRATHSRKEPIP